MVLVLDNYDSFTWNLVDYVRQTGRECKVYRNDEINIPDIKKLDPECIIISPGPGRPEQSGVTMDIIHHLKDHYPILGICLGFQAIGMYYGANLIKSVYPMHGKTVRISYTNHPLFEHISSTPEVMRYHSLILTNISTPLQVIAKTESDEIMAVAHQSLPIAGFQFHPESILTTDGMQYVQNWFQWIKKTM